MFLKKLTIVSVLFLGISLLGSVVAGNLPGKRELGPEQKEYPQTLTDIEITLDHLAHTCDLWHDAILKGDMKKAAMWEEKINSILKVDLDDSRRTVRHLARQSSMKNSKETKTESGRVITKHEPDKKFQHSLSVLNVKEHLSISFSRTEAFSNKYRLLSDYIDLLRKQLKMPKIKFAENESLKSTIPTSKQDN